MEQEKVHTLLSELEAAVENGTSKEQFSDLFKRAMLELNVSRKTIALALSDTIDPGIYTIEYWETGTVTPPEANRKLIFQTLGNIARQYLSAESE